MRWADVAKIGCPAKESGERCLLPGDKTTTSGGRNFSLLLGDSRFPSIGETSSMAELSKSQQFHDNPMFYPESRMFKDQKPPEETMGIGESFFFLNLVKLRNQ